MKKYLLLLPVTLALLLSGCASVPMADKKHDSQAKSFTPKTNLSNIYIYRAFDFGSGAAFEVTVDGVAVGRMVSSTFYLLEVPPGVHTVSTKLENPELFKTVSPSVEVTTKEGSSYFFEQHLRLTSNYLGQPDEATGKKDVSGCSMLLVSEAVAQKVASALEDVKKQHQQAAMLLNFAPQEKITAPSPIAGNSGKYRSPFTAAGAVALWAQKPVAVTDNGSDLAASVGGAVGQQVTQKALDFVPFGLGGMIGQKAGESAARAATKKAIEPELPSMDAVSASSDISFNSADELAVYMYAKNSAHGQYARVLALTQRVYPELQDAYTSAIEKASQASGSRKEKSADERLDALKKLKDKGTISESEFQAKRSEILKSL